MFGRVGHKASPQIPTRRNVSNTLLCVLPLPGIVPDITARKRAESLALPLASKQRRRSKMSRTEGSRSIMRLSISSKALTIDSETHENGSNFRVNCTFGVGLYGPQSPLASRIGRSTSAGVGSAGSVPVLRSSDGKLDSSFGGSASSLATLDSSSLVVQNPTNATSTAAASKIPLADAYGNIPGFNSMAESLRAGEALNTNAIVYVSSTGSVYKYSSSTEIYDTNLLGVVLATTSAASQVPILFEGIVRTMSGLTTSSIYYTGAASGTVSTSYTDQSIRLGIALSNTKLLLDKSQNKVYNLGAIAPVTTVSGGASNQPQYSTAVTVRTAIGEKIMVVAGGNLSAGSCDSASAVLQEDSADTNMNCSTLGGGCPLVYSTTTPAAWLHTYRVRANATDGGNCTATWSGNFTVWKF